MCWSWIDKPIQKHTLIQSISRVSRVCEGKDRGLIVDYIGIKKNMNLALKKYTNFECDEFEGVEQAFNLCSFSEKISGEEKDYIHFYCAVRFIPFKMTKGDTPDISQMNACV